MSQADASTDAAGWARLNELFRELVHATPEERETRLVAIGAQEPAVAAEVRKLLAADRQAECADTLTPRLSSAVHRLASELDENSSRPAWIGDYRIVGTLGSGGMGVVYLAEQESPRRTVALKVIRAFGGSNAVRRFQREAQLHGRLQHPGIAAVHEAGLASERDESGAQTGPPRPFFAMEFVRGEPVNVYVQSRNLSTDARVEIVARIADAVEHAHSRQVIHRDLKSANVLVDEAGNPKVLDFGIARTVDREQVTTYTAAGEVIGTLPYMSPEQVAGSGEATAQSDIYALGVVLFEVLTGKRPLDVSGRTLAEAARILTHDEPTRLGSADRALRGDLETIVGRCLEKEPARRYATAGALAADLRRYLSHRPIEARPASTIYQISKFTRRHRPLVIGTLTALAALLVATVVSVVMAVRAGNARDDLAEQLARTQLENRRSQQSYRFLSNMLTAADPTHHGFQGGDMTVRQLVASGAETLQNASPEDGQVYGQLAGLMGYTLFRLGDLEESERAMRRCVELLRKPDPSASMQEEQLIQGLNILGDVLCARGEHEEAIAVLTEAVEMREQTVRKAFLQRDPSAAGRELSDQELADNYLNVALNSLGVEQLALGQVEKAAATSSRAFAMARRQLEIGAQGKPAFASLLANKCKARVQLGFVDEAVSGSRWALAQMQESEGADSFFTDSMRVNLALMLIEAGEADEAAGLARTAWERRTKTMPPGHHETALAQLALAQALAAKGDAAGALPLAREAAQHLENVLGPRNPNVWRAWLVLADALGATDQWSQADEVASKMNAVLKDAFGDKHFRTADALTVMAAAATNAGHLERAAELAHEAQRIAGAAVGPRHSSTLRAQRVAKQIDGVIARAKNAK